MVYINSSIASLVSLDIRALQLQRGVYNFTTRNVDRRSSVDYNDVQSLATFDSDIKSLTNVAASLTSFTNRLENSLLTFDEVETRLLRMQEIVNDAVDNDATLTDDDRDQMQAEINTQLTEIMDIVANDTYNGESVLGGGFSFDARTGLGLSDTFFVDLEGEFLGAALDTAYTGGGDNIAQSTLGSTLKTTGSYIISSGPTADNRDGPGDTNIAENDGRLYIYKYSNTAITSVSAEEDISIGVSTSRDYKRAVK